MTLDAFQWVAKAIDFSWCRERPQFMGSGQEFLLTAQREDSKSNLLAKGEKDKIEWLKYDKCIHFRQIQVGINSTRT